MTDDAMSKSRTEHEKIPGETGYYVAPTSNNPDREAGWRWFPEYDHEH